MLRHVVIWSMGEGRNEELDGLLAELGELPSKIAEILVADYEF